MLQKFPSTRKKFFRPGGFNLGNSFIGIYGDSDRLHFFHDSLPDRSGRNLWYFYHFELETGIPDRYGGIVF